MLEVQARNWSMCKAKTIEVKNRNTTQDHEQAFVMYAQKH